jgi:hypothetical protein
VSWAWGGRQHCELGFGAGLMTSWVHGWCLRGRHLWRRRLGDDACGVDDVTRLGLEKMAVHTKGSTGVKDDGARALGRLSMARASTKLLMGNFGTLVA